jgi:hypothetical protein
VKMADLGSAKRSGSLHVLFASGTSCTWLHIQCRRTYRPSRPQSRLATSPISDSHHARQQAVWPDVLPVRLRILLRRASHHTPRLLPRRLTLSCPPPFTDVRFFPPQTPKEMVIAGTRLRIGLRDFSATDALG